MCSSPLWRRSFPWLAAALLSALLSALLPAQDAPAAAGGGENAQFYFATYPDFLVQFDPATDAVVRKIQFRHGMPWDVELQADNRRFTIVTDQQRKIEVVDLAAGAVVDVHDFAEAGHIVRVRSMMEIPGGKRWYVRTDRIKQELDRYIFEPSQYLLYDVAEKKVVERMRELPRAIRNGARPSPDGRYWHVFGRGGDLQIIDPETLKEVAKIDLSTPLFAGMGRLSLSRTDLFGGRDPKRYRMLCTIDDRVQKDRSTWGYVDIDLEKNAIGDLVEWGLGPSSFGTRVARNGKLAVGYSGGFGRGGGDRRTRFAVYDMETGKKLVEDAREFRPRRSISAISPDGSKVYVGGAGSDFLVFDSRTLEPLRTVEFDGEIYGSVYVIDA